MDVIQNVIRGYDFFYPRFWLKIVAVLLYIETFVTYMNISTNSLNDLLNIQLVHLLLGVIGVLVIIVGSFLMHIPFVGIWWIVNKFKQSCYKKTDLNCVSIESIREFAILDNNTIANNIYQKEKEKEKFLFVAYDILLLIIINFIVKGQLHQLCFPEGKGTNDLPIILIFAMCVYIVIISYQHFFNKREIFVGEKIAKKIKEITHRSVIGGEI